jgi:antitoxin MazE
MHTNLIRIGNSQGIRLPKAVIEQAELTGELDLEVANGAVIIRSAKRPRQGWAEAAAGCHSAGEDRLDDWDSTAVDFQGKW